MTITLTATQLSEPGEGLPLLIVGPSIGTSVTALWSSCAARLGARFHIVGWDLPGHGRSATTPDAVTMADLAGAVVDIIEAIQVSGGPPGPRPVYYAGDSVGGAVGLQLLLDYPERIARAAIISSGAKIGEPQGWRDRAELVRTAGTPVMIESSVRRWFAPGFLERQPEAAATLLSSLQAADRFGYAAVCEALAEFDVRDRLGEITCAVLVATGATDVATPVALGQELAAGLPNARFVAIESAGHLPPAEQPRLVADLLADFFASPLSAGGAMWEPDVTLEKLYDAGLAVRRQVLGSAHVDRASAAADDFGAEFQQLITRYAWGAIWTRPGLDRRSRSLITLTALVARGHHDELALHVRAALRNGVTVEEIKELLLQTAVYCGVPDANTAFRIARQVLNDARLEQDQPPGEDR